MQDDHGSGVDHGLPAHGDVRAGPDDGQVVDAVAVEVADTRVVLLRGANAGRASPEFRATER